MTNNSSSRKARQRFAMGAMLGILVCAMLTSLPYINAYRKTRIAVTRWNQVRLSISAFIRSSGEPPEDIPDLLSSRIMPELPTNPFSGMKMSCVLDLAHVGPGDFTYMRGNAYVSYTSGRIETKPLAYLLVGYGDRFWRGMDLGGGRRSLFGPMSDDHIAYCSFKGSSSILLSDNPDGAEEITLPSLTEFLSQQGL